MKIDPILIEKLKERVEATFKRAPKTPTDFDHLAADIYNRTKRTIGVSTLKRIWRYVTAEHGTSYSSLSLLCRYVGYADWDVFCQRVDLEPDRQTSGFGSDQIIACSILDLDTELLLTWLPDKSCRLIKVGQPDLFKVTEACNIKLQHNDFGHVNSLQIGESFLMTECRRGIIHLGSYRGARASGLNSIEIIE